MTKKAKKAKAESSRNVVHRYFAPPGADDRQKSPAWVLAKQAIRKRRTASIERFVNRQKLKRRWVSFYEIADRCARERDGLQPNEQRRDASYCELVASFLKDEFDLGGRSQVLWLSTIELETPKLRMDKLCFSKIAGLYGVRIVSERSSPCAIAFNDGNSLAIFHKEIIEKLWIPWNLCVEWLSARSVAVPSIWLAARQKTLYGDVQISSQQRASNNAANDFVERHIEQNGVRTTQASAWAAAQSELPNATREQIRAAFKRILPRKPGRPK